MARARRTEERTGTKAAPALESGWPDWADRIAVDRLRDGLRAGRVGHAYLFSGPKGVGKANLATAFAQAICCTALPDDDPSQPCGECRACRNVTRGAHPDVERVDLASQALVAEKPGRGANLTIETIRGLRASAALKPLEGKRRIIIVDDAETLLEPAQQALLKTLEEPPEAVILLLLADESDALLETVRSRCLQIPVRPVPESVIEHALRQLGITEGAAAEIALLSRGRPGWAMAASRDTNLVQSRRTERETAASWVAASTYERLVQAYKLGDQFSKRRAEIVGVVQAAAQLLREEMLGAANAQMTQDDEPRQTPASSEHLMVLSEAVRATLRCLADLEANVRPRLALEAMVLTWPNLAHPSR